MKATTRHREIRLTNTSTAEKELQKETGWSDFGARMFMADLGRWGAMDPLAKAEQSWNPYRYGFDNPSGILILQV